MKALRKKLKSNFTALPPANNFFSKITTKGDVVEASPSHNRPFLSIAIKSHIPIIAAVKNPTMPIRDIP